MFPRELGAIADRVRSYETHVAMGGRLTPWRQTACLTP